MAEADGNRTRLTGIPGHYGFEDRGSDPCPSPPKGPLTCGFTVRGVPDPFRHSGTIPKPARNRAGLYPSYAAVCGHADHLSTAVSLGEDRDAPPPAQATTQRHSSYVDPLPAPQRQKTVVRADGPSDHARETQPRAAWAKGWTR